MAGRHRNRRPKNPHTTPPPSAYKSTPSLPNPRSARIPFSYPSPSAAADPTSPILLSASADSPPIIAFINRGPAAPSTPPPPPSYEYDPMIVDAAGFGLGFHSPTADSDAAADPEPGSAETVPDPEADSVGGAGIGFATPERERVEIGSAYISIGGVRIYTDDTSSPEEGFEGDDTDSDSDDSDESRYSDEESDSGIDDEVAADYLEGIGGGEELLSAGWLAGASLDAVAYDEDGLVKSGSGSDGVVGKMAGMELMSASEAYGMKPRWKKAKGEGKSRRTGLPDVDGGVLEGWDDLLFKDSRRGLRKKKASSSASQLSQSWPGESSRSNKYRRFPGEKKKHRKESIATKRRERTINRGVDLDQINMKLRQMVVDEADILSFKSMHSRDCSQVRRLASIYRLQSGCQGSGKKRFVTVTRTGQSGLPSREDKLRLDQLLGAVEGSEPKLQKQTNARSKSGKNLYSGAASAPAKLTKSMDASRQKKSTQRSSTSYAKQPVSFVSCGIMQTETETETDIVTEMMIVKSDEVVNCETVNESSMLGLGAFEKHTKGFGSKMMSKMGFVEGGGLGKDGQGMVQPIEAVQRPKSLGLGVEFTEITKIETPSSEKVSGSRSSKKVIGSSSSKRVTGSSSLKSGSFEKHTKGFGSKTMTRIGFVEGGGLGKEGQGMVTPIDTTRRSKGMGLGGMFSEKNVRAESGSIGAFERHTKGFGSKVMMKMGFVPGAGLGRDAQGIVNPLPAVRRRRSQGLGA